MLRKGEGNTRHLRFISKHENALRNARERTEKKEKENFANLIAQKVIEKLKKMRRSK